MIVFINGRFVPEEQAVVSVFDRGFLYGDGLFETLRIRGGAPFLWEEHLRRLEHGARLLRLPLPCPAPQLLEHVRELARRNEMPDALLRINLSRGTGPRGYSIKGADQPTLVLSLHPAPSLDTAAAPRWRLITASVRLPANGSLAQAKSCNRIPQVLARLEADAAGVEEALFLNMDDHVAEGSTSNVFWIREGVVCTPPLASGGLPGVTRGLILALCKRNGIPSRQITGVAEDLVRAEGVFLSMTSLGVAQAVELDGRKLGQTPLIEKIRQAVIAEMLAQ